MSDELVNVQEAWATAVALAACRARGDEDGFRELMRPVLAGEISATDVIEALARIVVDLAPYFVQHRATAAHVLNRMAVLMADDDL